ncbi:MAG: type II CRISPR RNA-guided endonuclease Cas9 [Rhodocyclales bacterium]|nr:type II CRISPR RNA-guided endonuclease Cas9 [Rhodocyclales bacterium]
MTDKSNEALTFGFDIGIASVGWCVLGETRIVDLGVRCFDKAETDVKGESLNLARRTARLTRRRLRRRAWRLTKLARLLKRYGVIADVHLVTTPQAVSPWKLRVDGLDRRLAGDEWAHVIYHLCKHRGFHWISRAEEKKAGGDAKGEGGLVKKGLADTQHRMKEKDYRSAAEMVLKEFVKQQLNAEGEPKFDKRGEPIPLDAARNKQGDYGKALSRVLLGDELALLFQRQREFGNPHAGAELESRILGDGGRKRGLFWEQKPPLAGADLLKMLGKCTFEKDEYRAPKASFTAERHVWLTKLVNLKIVVDGVTRRLTADEVNAVVSLPYGYKSALKWKQLHNALIAYGLPQSLIFSGLTGKKDKDPLDQALINLPAWQELRETFEKANLKTEWQSVASQPELFDQIAWVLSVYKDGKEVEAELRKLSLPGGDITVDALSVISFDKFHNLSLKALRNIVPHMEASLRYDEACQAAGYHHSQLHKSGTGEQKYLPPFYTYRDKDGRMVFAEDMDIPKNPVVLRALNQARKVLNALVRRYKQSPVAVHIEMARDLSRPLTGHWTDNGRYIEGRRDIEKLQEEYRDRNENDKTAFSQEHGVARDGKGFGRDFEKFQLYREQNSQCPYCQGALDLNSVLSDTNYAQVDHALPYSRSFDDSKNNKVLVHTTCNQDKGNRTPYEYLTTLGGENGELWNRYKVWVEATYPGKTRQAKRTRLLRKDFSGKVAEEFKERNLNDTRYICKFFKNYVERHLQLKVGAGGTAAKRCVVLSGQTTAFLRARWGLLKLRGASDRHHALDAAVVAACSHSMVKRLGDYSRTKELAKARDGFPDPETGEIVNPAMFQRLHAHFPDPWPHFRDELYSRLCAEVVTNRETGKRELTFHDDPVRLREEIRSLGTYPPEALETVQPLFVSRAPQRRNGGAAHMDTIYAKPRLAHKLMVEDKTTQSHRTATPQELETMAIERVGMFDTADRGKKYRLTVARLEDVVDLARNENMVHSLRLWLAERGENPKKPGTNVFPRKPQKSDPEDGPFTGPEIKAVKLNGGKKSGITVRDGLAQNETMLRVDVFRSKGKDGKYHLVPVYVHHAVARELPNRAIVAFKDENSWTLIDDNFEFCFSAHPNDLLRITLKQDAPFGYYAGCDRSTGAVSLWAHDRNQQVGKDGLVRGVGVKTAVAVKKFHVDVLGNIYPAPPEQRRGLA